MTKPVNDNKKGFKETLLGQLPSQWKVLYLDEIAEVTMGQSPDSKYYNVVGEGLPLIQGNADCKNGTTQPRFWTTQITKTCDPGDLILSVRAPVGPVAISSHHACIGRGVCAIKPAQSSNYLFHVLISLENKWGKISQGSTFDAITSSQVKKLRIAVPPIKEQDKITAIISVWDHAIERVQRLIEAKHRQKKGLMQGLLTGRLRFPEFGQPIHKNDEIPNGWSLVRLNQISSLKAGGTPSTFVPQYWGGEIPWMNSGELNLKFVNSVNGRITESGMNNSTTSMVPKNSVLVGLAGQGKTRGTVAVNEIPLCTNQSIAAITPREEHAHYLFLYYNLDSRYWELRRMSAGDGGRGGLTLSILGNIHVTLPKLDEQLQIAQCLFLIDQNIMVLKLKKQMLNHQKVGLMQKLLTGEIRVKNH